MKNKKGISLIVLIITIIVVIILAAAVILTLSKNNPIESAKEATFKEDVRAYQDELNIYISKEYQQTAGARDWKITATSYEEDNSKEEYNNSVYKYLSSFKKKYENKLAIKEDQIAYVGFDEKEREWLVNSGIYMSKKFTVRYVNENGEELLPSEEISQLDVECKYTAKEVEGYLPIEEEKTGFASGNTTVTFEYCKICDDLLFIGLDESGNETEDESSIVAYTVGGIGNCTNTWVTIPRIYNNKEVTEVKYQALRGNVTIKKLVIQDNIQKINAAAFYGSNIEYLNVNAKSFSSIQAFQGSKIKEIYFGDNVENVASRSFDGCRYLQKIVIKTEKASFNGEIFQGSTLSKIEVNEDNNKYKVIDNILYSKDGTKIYLCAQYFGKTEFTFPKEVVEISYAAFRSNASLKNLILNSDIKKVASEAFSNCSNLEYVYLDVEDASGTEHFRNSSLNRIDIGKNVKKIGSVFFRGCNKLTEVNYLGTKEEWENISKYRWNELSNITKIICTDGEITL